MRARVAGIGVWFPPRVRENSEWPEEFCVRSAERRGDRTLVDIPTDADDRFSRIATRHLGNEAGDPFLGTTRRRVSDEHTSGRDAEAHAARAALEDARVDAADVDVILSWAIVPDRIVPSNACHVGHAIGAHGAWSMGVDAACASVVTQLTMAASLIESGRASTVLLTQSHWVTRAMPMMHPASPNVGDGASRHGRSRRGGGRHSHDVRGHRGAALRRRHLVPRQDAGQRSAVVGAGGAPSTWEALLRKRRRRSC